MIPAFMIGLREGLEAALIVGIVAAYLVKIGRRDTLPQVTLGVVAALGLSLVAGIVIILTIGRLPIAVQEGIEALAALVAVAVLTWMLFWMRRQGRAMKGSLEQGVQSALGQGSAVALIALVFFAVIRESLEMVLLLLAILSSEGATLPVAVGLLGGILGAVALGAAIFRFGVRVDLRRFFNITGFVLIFVAAGLCAFAVHALGEAGLINNTGTVIDLSAWLPTTSPLGTVLAGLFGYRSTPTPLEVVAYLAYFIPVMTAFVWGGRTRPKSVAPAATAIAAIALAIALAGCTSGATPTPAASASPATSVGASAGASPSSGATVVAVSAKEYAFDRSSLTEAAGQITFEVTNRGTQEHEFEIFKGDTVVDEIEGLLPTLTLDLTVTLEPGEYTYACKLNGHDALGMKGTLTVTGS